MQKTVVKSKRIFIVCFVFLLIFSLSGCSFAENESVDYYTITAQHDEYHGKLVSVYIENYSFDPNSYDLMVSNGQIITSGTGILSFNSEETNKLLNEYKYQYDINATKSKRNNLQNDKADIEKGDYSSSTLLFEEYKTLCEQSSSIKAQIESQEALITSAEINYQYNLSLLCNNEGEIDEQNPEVIKLKQLYEAEKNRNTLQLEKLKDEYDEMKLEIDNFADSDIVNEEIQTLSLEIERYLLLERMYNQQVSEIQRKNIVAQHDGLVVIDSNNVYVYSNELCFVMSVAAQNFQKFYSYEKEYRLKYNEEVIGNAVFDYYIPSQNENYYDLYYTIRCEENALLLTNSYAYLLSDDCVFIPNAYISKDENNEYFVMKDGNKNIVNVELIDGQYQLISGLEIGEQIERIN